MLPGPLGQGAILHASNAQAGNFFGRAVSISADGTTVVVGAYGESTDASAAGAAYVYTRSGSVWSETAILRASDAQAIDFFGVSVCVSANGKTIVVGASWEDTGGSEAGAAYVYSLSGSVWTETAILHASNALAGDFFGESVSLSSDGSTIVVGARGKNSSGLNSGAAYVYALSGSVWTETAILRASDAQRSDLFGSAVGVNSDGTIVVVGATGEATGGFNAGAAYVFTLSGVVWTESAILRASNAQAFSIFGLSVGISSDGATIVVGAWAEVSGASTAGAAYVYTLSSSVWTETAILYASNAGASDQFGRSVCISSDGSAIVVGATGEDTGGSDAGAAYVYRLSGSVWNETAILHASDAEPFDSFGWSVSVDSNGATTIAGAPGEGTGGSNAGAAYVYTCTAEGCSNSNTVRTLVPCCATPNGVLSEWLLRRWQRPLLRNRRRHGRLFGRHMRCCRAGPLFESGGRWHPRLPQASTMCLLRHGLVCVLRGGGVSTSVPL